MRRSEPPQPFAFALGGSTLPRFGDLHYRRPRYSDRRGHRTRQQLRQREGNSYEPAVEQQHVLDCAHVATDSRVCPEHAEEDLAEPGNANRAGKLLARRQGARCAACLMRGHAG